MSSNDAKSGNDNVLEASANPAGVTAGANVTPVGANPAVPTETCATCRHHAKELRPKVIAVFESISEGDSMLEIDDANETVFVCRTLRSDAPFRAGKSVGPTPIRCIGYEPGRKLSPEALDKLMGRFRTTP